MQLSSFNLKGEQQFRELLHELRVGSSVQSPLDLALDSSFIDTAWDTRIEVATFGSRFALARHVNRALAACSISNDMNLSGLWSWLAAVFFESICPRSATGNFAPTADYSFIPSNTHWHFYRHRIRGPVRILRLYEEDPDSAKIILCQNPARPGDFVEQLAARQERVTSHAVISTATLLYLDKGRDLPKRGAAPNDKRPGTLRRYIDLLDQLELTYDLYAIQSDELTRLLPTEFDRWKK